MMYTSFYQAQQQLAGITAIDYFFAKEFVAEFSGNVEQPNHQLHQDKQQEKLPEKYQTLWFHLLAALSESVRQGHTCLPLAKLANHVWGIQRQQEVITHHGYQFPALAEIESCLQAVGIYQEQLESLTLEVNTQEPHSLKPHSSKALSLKEMVLANNCLYMRRNFIFEQELQKALRAKLSQHLPIENNAIARVITQLFPDAENVEEIDWQQLAVANSIRQNFTVIAGGPGTGKTYTVTKLLAALVMLRGQQINIELAAPTGKAAQRLSESIASAVANFSGFIEPDVLSAIPTAAQTIHRLLGYIPNQVNFRKGVNNQLNADVLIIDEVSMVDLPLMARLFRAVPEHCQVIMLGDADQLPSVALGSVLADIAHRPHLGYSQAAQDYLTEVCALSAKQRQQLPKAKYQADSQVEAPCADHLSLLMKSRRFDGEGAIGKIAIDVIAGNAQRSWQYMQENSQQDGDIYLLPSDQQSWLSSVVERYYRPLLKATDIAQAFAALSQFRILCATRVGSEGVEAFNQQVIEQLLGYQYRDQLFHGLPIMINENHYGLNLYNGDIGLVWKNEQGNLVVYFEDAANNESGFRGIIPSRLPAYEPVYAMTIHKTQGSEFAHVAMVLPKQSDNNLLSRELVYTGITRAKQQLSISCNENVWFGGVEAKVQRYSNLSI
ncbi:exodeoxyribonuclease V subunit alpha [Colwellia sp. MEBiC06753]